MFSPIMRTIFLFACMWLSCPIQAAIDWLSPYVVLEGGACAAAANRKDLAIVGAYNRRQNRLEFFRYNFDTRELDFQLSPYPCASEVQMLHIKLDNENTLFAAWFEKENCCFKVARTVLAENGTQLNSWPEPVVLSTGREVRTISVNCDEQGNAFVIWEQDTGYDYQVKMTRYSSQRKEWSSVLTLSSLGEDCHSSRVALDREGNVIVAWCLHHYTNRHATDQLRVIRVASEEVYEIFMRHESHFNVQNPDLLVDSGNVVRLVWERKKQSSHDGIIQSWWMDLNSKTEGDILDLSVQIASSPSIVMVGDEPYALWITKNHGGSCIYTQSLANPNRTLKNVSCRSGEISQYVTLADAQGKMHVVVRNREQVKAFLYEDAWMETNLSIQAVKAGANRVGIGKIQAACDTLGNCLAIWSDGGNIQLARGDYLTPPRRLSVKRAEKRYPARTIMRAQLTWAAKDPAIVVGYRVWRNQEFLDEVSSTMYLDRCCPKGRLIYSVSSVNKHGLESRPAQILFEN